MLFSILYFVLLIYCLGFSITFFVKKPKNILEQSLMNLGFGLAVFSVLAVFLNLIKIQLHWAVFLFLSLIVPAYAFYRYTQTKNLAFPSLKFTKSNLYILFVILIFFAFFAVYLKGAFTYPYLEDDDPWFHAKTAKYVAEHRTLSHDPSVNMKYNEPYPPAYAALMGVLHQTNNNIIWNLKFFNALLVSFSIIFFFFFAKELFDSRRKALFSTFIIAVIPCFLSHFIWASTLAIILFFPAFYAVERIRYDKKWWFVACVSVAGVLLSQPSNAAIFGILFGLYWFVKVLTSRSFQSRIFFSGLFGLVLSFAIFYLPMILKYGWEGFSRGVGFGSTSLLHFSAAGSGGGLLYSLSDFIFAETVSKMDNPIGLGVFLFFLLVFSILVCLYNIFKVKKKILSDKTFPCILLLAWLLFSFLGIHGNRLPIQLMPHRFWAIFAIPVALLCAEGFFLIKKIFHKKEAFYIVSGIILVGILITSAYPKYVVETSYWPPGVNWGSMTEVQGYITHMRSLPDDTKVFPLCSDEFKVLAFDKYAEPWDPDYQDFKNKAFNLSAEDIHSWLDSRGYEYMTMDAYCIKEYSLNETNEKFNEFKESGLFNLAAAQEGFFLMKLI